ncbi:MAG: DUF1566 domain-containing protein [Rubrivivax sp.]|nr:DUF1566 domain-containing protein [Rubrivivax sp.]
MNAISVPIRHLSRLSTVGLFAIALLGCGGDDEHSAGGMQSAERRFFALSSNTGEVSGEGLAVTQLEKTGETRVGRTLYDYTFKITVENRARVNARGVQIQLMAVGTGSSIVDGTVKVGVVRAVAGERPDDTVTIRHDRATTFDASALKWSIQVDSTPARFMGRFIDRPVKNAYFQTESGYGGFTDETGAFYYDAPGELIEFSIGGRTTIGTAAAAPTIHAYDLTTDMGRALPGERVAQLLQSVDLAPGTLVLSLPEVARTSPPSIDYFAPTLEFETAVGSLMAAYQVPRTGIVPIEAARNEAQTSIASINCPVVVALPVEDGGLFKPNLSRLTCLEKARIEFFNRRVKMFMNLAIDEGLAQVNLIEETFSATAVEKIIDDSPMLAAIDGAVDVLNTLQDLTDAKKKEAHFQLARLGTQAAAWIASMAAKSGPVTDNQDIAKWTARTAAATTVLFQSQECARWWGAKKDKRGEAIAACAKALSDVLGVPAIVLHLVVLESAAAAFDLLAAAAVFDVNEMKGKKALRGGAQLAAAFIKSAAKTSELALLEARRNGKDPGPLLEGVSQALSTGVSELASGIANCTGIGKNKAGAFAACRMAAVSLTSKALIRSSMLSVGVGAGVRAAGRITDTRVAVGMLEDLLYAGDAGQAALFGAYGVTSETDLARAMGTKRFGYEAVTWDALMARKLGNIVQGQLIFNPTNVEREVAFWKSYVESQVQPEFSSTDVSITATVQADRRLLANVSFDAAVLGLAGGDLVCRAIGATDDAPIVVEFDQAQAARGIEVQTGAFQEARIATLVCSVYSDQRLIATKAYFASVEVGAAKIPGTGITANQCYAAGSNALVACDSPGAVALNGQQDGHRAGVNAMSYSLVGAYSKEECVRDDVTGLVWEGKTSSGARAGTRRFANQGTVGTNDADGYVREVNDARLCGFSDWRLPTAIELQGLVNYGVPSPGPTISTTWFPNTTGAVYWTADGSAERSSEAWYVNFDYGSSSWSPRNLLYAVRLVRGTAQPPRYTFNSTGDEVTDTRTGLVWRRCVEGMTWNGSTCTGASRTFTHEGALAHAQSQAGWRLPSVKDLGSIADRRRMTPALDTAVFPAVSSGYFWTTTPLVGSPSDAWHVRADTGAVFNTGGRSTGSLQVRLVRTPLIAATGRRYEVIECGSWTQCRSAARARGGELATVRSQVESDWLTAYVLPQARTEYGLWIGLNDEAQPGVFSWSSGEAVTFTNWRVGEPNNRWVDGRAETYVHMWRGNSTPTFLPGVWNDIIDQPIFPVGGTTSIITQAIVEYPN